MNEYDTNRIYDIVKKIGYFKTDNQLDDDCYLLNTCHIRDKSKEKVFDEVGRVRKNYRNKKKPIVIIAGCVAQAESGEMIKREPYIDIIIGPQSYHQINKIIKNFSFKKKQELTEFDTEDKFNYLDKIKNSDSKVSSFLTIQEGCDKFCSFCVVPFTRGAETSRRSYHIFDEVNHLVENGCKEVVLLGQNVNAYHGVDKYNNEVNLANLITSLEKIKDLKRISYTTSHPVDMHEELIELHGYSKKLNPYLHLPVQSGSDKILKLMNRKYTKTSYLQIIDRLRNKCSDIALSSDFIVGYPDETRRDFQDTLDLVKEVNFAQAYSFKYSSRVGTKSAKNNINNISNEEKNDRLQELQELLNSQQKKFNTNFVSKKVEVLVKGKGKKINQYRGTTKWMQVVNFELSKEAKSIENVKIIKASNNSLLGESI